MANPAAIITEYIRTYDGVDPTSDNEADTSPRRARLLVFLNHINSYIHYFREWEWTYVETTFNLAGGLNTVSLATALPTYLEFGREGGLFDSNRMIMLRESPRHVVERARRFAASGSSAAPDTFTVFGGSIHLPYVTTGLTAFTAFHRRVAESLADNGTAMLLPDRYANTVLMPGLCYRAQESKNDARQTWAAQFREGLSQMCAAENPIKTRTRKWPLAIRGGW